jgi:hypothetical protein
MPGSSVAAAGLGRVRVVLRWAVGIGRAATYTVSRATARQTTTCSTFELVEHDRDTTLPVDVLAMVVGQRGPFWLKVGPAPHKAEGQVRFGPERSPVTVMR